MGDSLSKKEVEVEVGIDDGCCTVVGVSVGLKVLGCSVGIFVVVGINVGWELGCCVVVGMIVGR